MAIENLPIGDGGNGGTAAPAAGDGEADKPRALPTHRASQQQARFEAVSDKIVSRTDLAAKFLLTAATAGISAFGAVKGADFFPYPYDNLWQCPVLAAVLGFLGMVGAAIFFGRRLWQAQRPITFGVVSKDMLGDKEIDQGELEMIDKVYERTAVLNGCKTLKEYNDKVYAKDAEADAKEKDKDATGAAALRAEANQIATEIEATIARARMLVLRTRSSNLIADRKSIAAFFAFLVGLLAFSLAGDAISADREGETAAAKTCAEARAVDGIVTADLSDICAEAPAPKPDEDTAAKKSDDAITALATAHAACRATAAEQKTSAADCDPLRAAIAEAVREPASP